MNRVLGLNRLFLWTMLSGLSFVALAARAEDGVKSLDIPAKFMLWDASTHRIYASVPGSAPNAGSRANSVVVINPDNGQIVSSTFVGAEPSKLCLSLNRKYLFVVLDGANAVRVYDLAKQAAGPMLTLGPGLTAADIAPVPGMPDSVAVEQQNRAVSPSESGTMIFNADGSSLKNTINGGHSILYDPLTNRLYGFENQISSYGLRVMTADKDGTVELEYTEGLLIGNTRLTDVQNGILFSDSANVVDPIAKAMLGQYPGYGYGSVLAADASTGRVYFAAGDRGGVKLTAFDMYAFTPVGTTFIQDTKDYPPTLIRWGDDGLAFTTANGKIWIVRTPLVGPKRPATDLGVSASGWPPNFPASGKVALSITVTNLSSVPATGVTVLDQLSPNVDVVSVNSAVGTATAANGVARLELGTLAPGAKASLNVELMLKPQDTTQEKPLTGVSHMVVARAKEPDSNLANNRIVQSAKLDSAGPAAVMAGIDLTGAWKSLSQMSEGAGADLQSTVQGEFEVRNVGMETAGPSRLRFFLSGERAFDPAFSQLLQESGVPELKPGGTYRIALKARLRKGDDAIGLFVIAIVNATNTVNESNKKNNILPGGPIP